MPFPAQSFHVLTYGCQMNDADSAHVVGLMESHGLEQTARPEEADLVFVNTCCVREGAESRSVSRLASLSGWRRRDRMRRLVVMGCTAQKEGEAMLREIPHADLVVGTRDLAHIESLLIESYQTGQRRAAVGAITEPVIPQFGVHMPRGRIRGLVNIMAGCNNSCSFCIVPATRGAEVSRPAGEIVGEIERLVDQGAREVLLLGQNVNSYRGPDGTRFPALLEQVNAVDGLARIRFITSHPKDMSPGLIAAMRDLPKVMEAIHLPVQAGANRTLARMRRSHTRERYVDLIRRLREALPPPASAVTTDLIVGFPGETDADFEETMTLVDEVRWDAAFTFHYSPREGTPAFTMDDDVPPAVKQARLARLIARQEAISEELNRALADSEVEVLFEGASRRGEHALMGRTRTDKPVIVEAPAALIGTVQRVRVTGGAAHTLFGELIAEPALAGGALR